MNNQALQAVYRSLIVTDSYSQSVVIAKLLNAACAWWGFTMDDDKRIEAVVRREPRAGLYPVDRPAAAQLVEDSDDVLFSRIQNSDHHTFYMNCCRTHFRFCGPAYPASSFLLPFSPTCFIPCPHLLPERRRMLHTVHQSIDTSCPPL